MNIETISRQAKDLLLTDMPTNARLQAFCDLLHEELLHYDWVGFYFTDETGKALELGPYAGAETEHTHIAFGAGICGQAAATKKTFVIDDVNAESNYIACSIHVKSEIVVPLINNSGEVLGEIDIDSHKAAAFDAKDQVFLEEMAQIIVEKIL